jgi:hypothetical protein
MPIDDSKAGAGKEKTARPIVSPSVAAQIKAAAMTEGVAPEPAIATAGQLPMPAFKAKVPSTPARITGVGFFDRVHGQMGVALSNGIELHPVLDIKRL